MRSIWSGAISFGLINIPIKLYPATSDKNIDFDYLHKKDLSPVRYAKVCEHEEKEISYKDLVRGYEYREGDFVVVTDDDMKRASVKRTDTIEILQFAKTEEVDTEYFEKPYYMEPEKSSQKAYYLLLEALKQSKKVAIARFFLRNRESLAILKPHFNIIVLNKIRFEDEIRDAGEITAPKEQVKKSELEMALSLVNKLTKHFDPKDYPDSYKENLEKVIKARAKGKPLPKETEKVHPTKVKDLMTLLKESLKENGDHQHNHVYKQVH